jgi:rare lipoprotein A
MIFRLLLAALAIAGVATPARAETCIASQYGVGDGYHGKHTASGARFNTYAGASGRYDDPFTVAHKTHRFGTVLRITNLANGRAISAVVTDRGPFVKGRCVDLGRAGANAIGMGGTARVSVE